MVSVTGVLGLIGIYAAVDLLPWMLCFYESVGEQWYVMSVVIVVVVL